MQNNHASEEDNYDNHCMELGLIAGFIALREAPSGKRIRINRRDLGVFRRCLSSTNFDEFGQRVLPGYTKSISNDQKEEIGMKTFAMIVLTKFGTASNRRE